MAGESPFHILTSKTLSAGGQEEQPSDVNNSTTASFALDGVAHVLDKSNKVTSPIFSAVVLLLVTPCMPQELKQHQKYTSGLRYTSCAPSTIKASIDVDELCFIETKPIPLVAGQPEKQVYLPLSLTPMLSFE